MVMKKTPLGLVVFIPDWMKPNSPQVRAFIEEGIAKLGVPTIPQTEVSTVQELRALVKIWAKRLNVTPKRITFREMYRKWGSCSSKGNVSLNSALLRVPRELAEYVIMHELVHLRVFNHGKDFKAVMTAHMPDWKERETILDKYLTTENTEDLR
jgi:hypothetical protein